MPIKKSIPVQPFQLYNLDEASGFLRVNPEYVRKLVKNKSLKGRIIGKGYQVLGEELLRFVGTPTISPPTMQPDQTAQGVPPGNLTAETLPRKTSSQGFGVPTSEEQVR